MMKLEVIHRAPEGEARPTPLLFVHGAWHGAWYWDEFFLPYFAGRGYDSYALSLRGHGESEGREKLRWASARQYVEDVAQVAGELPAPPVVIGHSMGGFVVQKYLETHQPPAAVLMASIPTSGSLYFLLRSTVRYPLAMLKATVTMSAYPVIQTPEMGRHWFFSPDMPEEQVRGYHARAQDESFRVIFDTSLLALPRTAKIRQNATPLLVLGAENDKIFLQGEVRATARAYGVEAEFFPNMAHDMMLEKGWQAVADRIIGWLGERGL
jgi:pimeloyl-ACP methyl ester carboxylesterase